MELPGLQYLLSLAEWKGEGFSLDKVRAVLKYLNDPQDTVTTIIIGGTNGKGSVSAGVASILGAAGYRVGLNISPHLSEITERVVIDGFPIEKEILNEHALEVRRAAEECNVRLSFHEGVTVAYFLIARELELEWSILEVGLGGLYDAANVVNSPKAVAIVTIGFDHEHILGNSLGEIALAKAGIIRENGVVICGNLPDEAATVIDQQVQKLHATQLKLGSQFSWRSSENQKYSFFLNDIKELEFSSPLPGEHQLENLSVAIALCRSLGISTEACSRGATQVFWPGRLEWLEYKGQMVLLDCAHNPSGTKSLTSYLDSLGLRDLKVVFGVVSSKRWQEMIEILKPYVARWSLATPNVTQALESDVVENHLSRIGISSQNFGNDYEALLTHTFESPDNTPVLITGSIYLLGSIRAQLVTTKTQIWKRNLECH